MACLGCVLLALAFFAFSFGAARVLLKGTAFEKYTFEAAFLLGPMLIALVFALGGYVFPERIWRGQVWLVLLLGWGISAVIAFRDRLQIRDIFRENRVRLAILLIAGVWSAAVILLYFPGNIWKSWYFLGNGEYVNYAELAAYLTGQCTPTPERPMPDWVIAHHQIRYGQDIITAATAQLGGLHPLNVVLPLSVFYRFQYAIALGLLLFGLVQGKHRHTIVLLLLFFDGYLLVETFNFTTSFMSSNCTICLYLLYLTVLVTRPEAIAGRLIALGVLANVYFLITYPEFLVVVKAVEGAHFCWWLIRRKKERWQPVLLVNLATLLLHPMLVFEHAHSALLQAASSGGWNIFGDPLHTPLTYLANLFGLRYAHIPDDPFGGRQRLVLAMLVVLGILIVAGLCILANRRELTLLIGAWAGLVLYSHAAPLLQEGKHFYVAVKLFTQTMPVLLACLAVLAQARRRPVRWVAWAGGGGWAIAAAFASMKTSALVPRYCDRHDLGAIRQTLAEVNQERQPVACLCSALKLRVLHLAANELGIPVIPLSSFQSSQLQYLPSAPNGRSPLDRSGEDLECILAIGNASRRASCEPSEELRMYEGSGSQRFSLTLEGRNFEFCSERLLASVDDICLLRGRLRANGWDGGIGRASRR